MAAHAVLALYKFTRISDPQALQSQLRDLCERLDLLGTLIVAEEGLNGTVSGSLPAIARLRDWLAADGRFEGMEAKVSGADEAPFYRLKVLHKPEIVALRADGVNPAERTGQHVEARDWNAVLEDPEIPVIDCRNDFEVRVGTFEGSVDPATKHFTEFPEFVATHFDPAKHPKVAMFCTGGIRCEKASALLLDQGFEEVLQLRGGILRYLEDVPESESKMQGECFVFDRRVSVGHDLRLGTHVECHGCKQPVAASEREHPDYEEDVSCMRCASNLTSERREKLRERSRQVRLAQARGAKHIAAAMPSSSHGPASV